LWIEGKYIGAFDDVNILSSILFELEGLDPEIVDGEVFAGLACRDIYEIIKTQDNCSGDKYYFTPGEAFDDFSIVVYAQGGNFNFIWKLHSNPYFEYLEYSKDIQSAQVSVIEFRRAVLSFGKILKNNY